MGVMFSQFGMILGQNMPPKSQFTVEQMPDLTGKVLIVTGGNTGIGKEHVKALLAKNATVYLAARSKEKAETTIQSLKAETGKEAIFLELNLGKLEAVRQAAEEFLSKETELHILFNNAGVMMTPKDQLTADGYDLQFGTNVIAHYYFTRLLVPALLAGKKTAADGHARVVFASSLMAYMATITWDSFRDGPVRNKMSTSTLYSQSKFADAVVAREFARRYGDQGIISVSANPGNITTELQRHMSPLERWFTHRITYPTPMGALTSLYAGTMPEALEHNGEFFIPWARAGRLRKELYDDALGDKLWEWLESETKTSSA